jgi:hypothetical protein
VAAVLGLRGRYVGRNARGILRIPVASRHGMGLFRVSSLMRFFTVILFSVALALPARAAAEPALPTSEQPSILAGEDGPAWRDLFATLSGQGAVAAAFLERRWFAVRKQPVVLEGEMRMSPQHGLSLHYLDKRGRTMIVDEKGVLLRDDRGRSRTVPADSPAAGAGALLLPVMQFDLPELEKQFVISGTRDGGAWRLELVPRQNDLGQALRSVVIAGSGSDVDQLVIDRGEKQRIEIEIADTRTGVTFSAEEQKRFFRSAP